ncbi:MAG TPA: PKD domain-containing protein [Thermoplasmata archaeon]|nr:PKD domain-containing protein [Thermoplasmata archaeon]
METGTGSSVDGSDHWTVSAERSLAERHRDLVDRIRSELPEQLGFPIDTLERGFREAVAEGASDRAAQLLEIGERLLRLLRPAAELLSTLQREERDLYAIARRRELSGLQTPPPRAAPIRLSGSRLTLLVQVASASTGRLREQVLLGLLRNAITAVSPPGNRGGPLRSARAGSIETVRAIQRAAHDRDVIGVDALLTALEPPRWADDSPQSGLGRARGPPAGSTQVHRELRRPAPALRTAHGPRSSDRARARWPPFLSGPHGAPRASQRPDRVPPSSATRRGKPRSIAFRAALSIAVTLFLAVAAYQSVSDARATSVSLPVVTGGSTVSATIGQSATVTATISGGVPISSVVGSFSGYLVLWFYGQTDSSGGIGHLIQQIGAPSGCTTPDVACSSSTSVSFSHVYTAPGSYDTSFTVYDAIGDYSTGTVVVNVNPPTLIVHPTASTLAASEDAPITFSATATTVPTSYESDAFAFEWDLGDGNSTWGSSVSHAYNISGNYVVTLTGFDNRTGAAGRAFLTNLVITDPGPVAAFDLTTPSTSPGVYPDDTTVGFSAAGTTAVPSAIAHLRYSWDFGDGTLGAGLTASHEYTAPGSYPILLTVVDPEGHSSAASGTVRIIDLGPTASTASSAPFTSIVGQAAALNGSATTAASTDLPGLNYSWTTGVAGVTDMASSSGVIGRAGYFVPGTYPVGLSVTDPWGLSSSASLTQQVVDAAPNVGLYSAYTLVNLTLAMKGTPGNTLNLSVLEDGKLIAWGTLTRGHGNPASDVLTLVNVPLSLADQDVLLMSYVGGSQPNGANPVDLTLNFWGDAGGKCKSVPSPFCAPQIYTHQFHAKDAGTSVGNWTVDGNAASLGQIVFLKAQVFSPARSGLSTVWSFGDGSSTLASLTPMPPIAEPTLGTISTSHRWLPGADFALSLTTTDSYGLHDVTTVPVFETTDAQVLDVAPTVALTNPASLAQQPSVPLSASIVSEDYGATSFNAAWQFGDGLGAATLGVGPSVSIGHLYRYASTVYALVVFASDGPNGYTTASWAFLSITNPGPEPEFVAPLGPVTEFDRISFDGGSSTAYLGAPAGQDLSYLWQFGDGTPSGVLRGDESPATHQFTREGTFPVTLTVADLVGQFASITEPVTVGDVAVLASLPTRTVTVDEMAIFAPSGLSASPYDAALLSGSWHWGDGQPDSLGLTSGHTYLALGTFAVTLSLSDEDGHPVAVVHGSVVVVDQPLLVVLPYSGATVYGENHTAPFTAIALGSRADALSSGPFVFDWTFGDGSAVLVSTSTGLVDTVGHIYTMAGNPVVGVTVDSPFGTSASASATLTTVPNWAGDGIPDVYGATVLGIHPGSDPSSGSGLNFYLERIVVGGANSSSDTDHDGLTDAQEAFGSVTGFVTNPLVPNSAGDSILDGSHRFTDSFASTQVVQFSSSGSVGISGVQHPGPLVAISQVQLYYEIVSASLGALDLHLTDLGPGPFPVAGTSVDLGAPAAAVGNVTLIHNAPTTGPSSPFSGSGLTLAEFASSSNWALSVSGGAGSIESASILVSYYTDPNHADPFLSGLTTGGPVSIPVFNCTEPTSANYSAFDGHTITFSKVFYYPYTLQYWQLSVVQGLPHYASENLSYNRGTAPGCSVTDPHAWATYYGDRQFHLPPWAVHAAGDLGLTDGEQAYGAGSYDATANHYETPTGGSVFSQQTPYPWDGISYQGPLNPSALSTGTNGAPDSLAINPVAGPAILGVHITSARSTCISIFDFGADGNAGGVVQIQDTSYPGSPSMYTESEGGSNDFSFGDTCIHWSYGYNDFYQLPIDPTASTITIDLNLWQEYSLGNGAAQSDQYTFSSDPSQGVHSFSGDFGISFQVFHLARMPVVLLNSTGEVPTIPGYGSHWAGDQHLYEFYLTLSDSGTGTPFQPGENLLLVSRTAFGNSSFNRTLGQGRTSDLPCLNGASLSDRGTSSDTDILGTLSATVSSSCALALLAALTPHNKGGAVQGAYHALSQVGFELLGLGDQIAYSAPYFPISGFDSPVGVPPTNFWQALGSIITSIVNAIVSVVLAVANFIVNLAIAIGQAILGAWNAVVSAVEAAIQAIISALDFILQWVEQQLNDLFHKVVNALETAFGEGVAYVALPFLSILVGTGALSSSAYNSSMQSIFDTFNLSGPILSPLDVSTAGNDLGIFLGTAAGVFGLLFALVGLVMYIIDIVSLGTATGATEGASTGVQAAVVGIVAGGLAALLAAGSILTALTDIVPNFGGTDPFSQTIDWIANSSGASLGLNIASDVLTFFQGLADAIVHYLAQSLDGNYIVGLAVGFLALIAAILSVALTDTLAQVILAASAVVLAAIGVIVQLYPSTQVADDASQTGIADAAGIALGLAGLGLSIPSLINAAEKCANSCT